MNRLSYLCVVFLLMLIGSCSNLSETAPILDAPTLVVNTTATVLPMTQPVWSATAFVSPEPTLSSNDRETYITLMLINNNSCNLPCWWGIETGKATWVSVETMLSYLGTKANKVEYGGGLVSYGTRGLGLDSIGISPNVSFYVKDDLVKNITISVFSNSHPGEFQQAWEYYSPDEIILKYGKPSRIKLFVSTYGETSNVGYEYWLYYDDLGFLITYGGGAKRQENLHICPKFKSPESESNQISAIQIYLQSPSDKSPLETVVGNERIQLLGSDLKDFEDVVGMSIDEYYDGFMLDNENICFETPSSLW